MDPATRAPQVLRPHSAPPGPLPREGGKAAQSLGGRGRAGGFRRGASRCLRSSWSSPRLRRAGQDQPPTPRRTRRRRFPSLVAKFGICQMAGLSSRLLYYVCGGGGGERRQGGPETAPIPLKHTPAPSLPTVCRRPDPSRGPKRPRAAPQPAAGRVPAAPALPAGPGPQLQTRPRCPDARSRGKEMRALPSEEKKRG